jgi:hypothetical protein
MSQTLEAFVRFELFKDIYTSTLETCPLNMLLYVSDTNRMGKENANITKRKI